MEVGSHVDTLSLFRHPNKWPPASLSGLHIEEHANADAVAIFGEEQLPKDDDPWFATLATDFATPPKQQLPFVPLFENQFWRCFDGICVVNDLSKNGDSIQQELGGIVSGLIRKTQLTDIQYCSAFWKTPFYLESLKIRGKLTWVSKFVQPDDLNMPLTLFVSTKGQGDLCPPELIVPYILFQAILKYERNSSKDSHNAYVVSMKGTSLQFNKGVVSREYLKDLICQRVPADPLVLLRSQPYDLLEQDDRKECLRTFMGLIRTLNLECA